MSTTYIKPHYGDKILTIKQAVEAVKTSLLAEMPRVASVRSKVHQYDACIKDLKIENGKDDWAFFIESMVLELFDRGKKGEFDTPNHYDFADVFSLFPSPHTKPTAKATAIRIVFYRDYN